MVFIMNFYLTVPKKLETQAVCQLRLVAWSFNDPTRCTEIEIDDTLSLEHPEYCEHVMTWYISN